MKVLILSDLHLEFAPFAPVPDLEFDVVILAGDIHSPAKRAVQWAADQVVVGGTSGAGAATMGAGARIGTCGRMRAALALMM